MRTLNALILIAFLGFLSQSCISPEPNKKAGGQSTANPPEGENNSSVTLRAVHLSPDAPNVDIYVNNNRVINNLPYYGSSSFLSLNGSNINARINPVNSGTSVINAEVSLEGNHNTIFALNNVSSLETLIVADDRNSPGFGQIKVRVIHAVSVVGTVDVYVLDSTDNCTDLSLSVPALTSVPFKGVSPYLTIASGTYDVCVALSGSSSPAIVAQDVVLSSGSVSTIIAANAKNDFASFGFIVLDDLGINSPVLLY